MKIRISDMMDYAESIPVDIRERDIASAQRIKEVTMNKIHKDQSRTRRAGKISRVGVVAAVVAAVLCITAGAVAVGRWGGFALTGGMSDAEKAALIEEISGASGYSACIDEDGTVHYMDQSGKEVLVLSEKEAAKFENERLKAREQAAIESTSLVDVATMPLIPRLITEMEVDGNGRFQDTALGNGSMLLLHPAGEDGFELSAGDVVTIELTASDVCYVEFGEFRDGVFADAETHHEQRHSHSFTIEEAGVYCFYVEYYSANASTFTDCSITIS